MLSINECRKYLGNTDISDKEVEQLRNALYSIAGLIIDHTVSENEENNSDNWIQTRLGLLPSFQWAAGQRRPDCWDVPIADRDIEPKADSTGPIEDVRSANEDVRIHHGGWYKL